MNGKREESGCRELWRDIPGFAGSYQVSSLGRVRSLPRLVPVFNRFSGVAYARRCPGKILRPAVCDKAGHVSVRLGRGTRGIPVHQLVMLAFYGMPPPGTEAMHLNGIPTDNRVENLQYGSHTENMIAMCWMGKGRVKLTPERVREIRLALSCGRSCRDLAEIYGVSASCIRDIGKRRRYAWVA